MNIKKLFSFLIVAVLSLSVCLLGPVAFASEVDDPEVDDPVAVSDQSDLNPIYFTCYDMMQEFIYGSDAQLTEHMELTLTILATICSLFVVVVPFVVVFFVIRLITGR